MTIEDVIALLPEGSYLAGGAARAYMLRNVMPEPIRDVDLFFADHETWLDACGIFYRYGWRGVSENLPGVQRMMRDGAPWPIDFVAGRTAPNVETLIDGFDFECCRFGWSHASGWISRPSAVADAMLRTIRINTINGTSARTRLRVERYQANGWTIDPESDFRLIGQELSEILDPPKNPEAY